MVEAQSRARAYQLLGEHFDVRPPPPMGGGGHVLVYDYDAIDTGVRELYQIAARAENNLDAAVQTRFVLQQRFSGSAAEAAQQELIRVEQINRRIIAAVAGALRALDIGNHDMERLDQQNAAAFP